MPNVFIVPSYKCNAKCEMCLFRLGEMKECSNTEFVHRLHEIAENPFCKQGVKVKITGGEPFLSPFKVAMTLEVLRQENVNIEYVGIGTNGTHELPTFLKHYDFPICVYVSRHGKDTFKTPTIGIPKLVEQAKDFGLDLRLSCVMMMSGISNSLVMRMYLAAAQLAGVKFVCFRELNTITTDDNLLYDQSVHNYQKFYNQQVVKIDQLLHDLELDPDFEYQNTIIKPYTTKMYWKYKGIMTVLLKRVDEVKLIEHNRQNKGIDELVLHPDGLITGCWDRNLKVIKEAPNA